MKKIFFVFVLSFVFMGYSADKEIELNLRNGDVLHCLISAAEKEGWKLISVYDNIENKRVVVFAKGKDVKRYVGVK
ncbi:hypothetical protein [Thalassobellus citreus]|uniref:hypothetical protein n=1 Tax=Thalassobellus citreus TaxID=3367752 RepID=UPI0037A39AF3